MNFWDFFWLMVWGCFLVTYLMILFHVIADLFRDADLNGWLRALWIVALLIVPLLTLLIYLVARGRDMAERDTRERSAARAAADEQIESIAGRSGPADQIVAARKLLDSGAITDAEFRRLKEKALA